MYQLTRREVVAGAAGIALSAGLKINAVSASTLDPNNRPGGNVLVVTAKNDSKIQFFDAKTLKKLADLDMPGPAHELATSLDGKKVFASVYGGGIFGRTSNPLKGIAVIDPATRKIEQIFDTAPHLAPHGMKMDAAGLLWFTSELDNHVAALDTSTGKIAAAVNIGTSAHWLAISQKTGKLFSANKQSDHVTVVDIASRKVADKIAVPSLCEGAAVSPDGETLFVCSHTKTELLVIDTSTLKVRQALAYDGGEGKTKQLRRVHVSPDQKYILVSNHMDNHSSIFEYGSLKQVGSTITEKAPMGYGFSADGKRAYVCCHDAAHVFEIEMATGRVTREFRTARGCEYILSVSV